MKGGLVEIGMQKKKKKRTRTGSAGSNGHSVEIPVHHEERGCQSLKR